MDPRESKFKRGEAVNTDANYPREFKRVLYICPSTEPIWVEKAAENPNIFKEEGYTHVCFVSDADYVRILDKKFQAKGGEYNIQHIKDIHKEKEERLNNRIILYRDDRTGKLYTPDELNSMIKDYKSSKIITFR